MTDPKVDAFPNAYLETNDPPKRGLAITVASVLFIILGLGSAVATLLVLVYIILYGTAPVVFGIDLLDGRSLIGTLWGMDVVLVLGLALVAASFLLFVSGIWLRHSLKKGGKLWVLLFPFILLFAVGFGIPALYLILTLGTILLAFGWKGLR